MIEKRRIELAIGGKYSAFVLLRLFDLKIPEQVTRFRITRFKCPIQNADENDIASDRQRRKHVRFSLLTHNGLAAVCVNHVIQTGI